MSTTRRRAVSRRTKGAVALAAVALLPITATASADLTSLLSSSSTSSSGTSLLQPVTNVAGGLLAPVTTTVDGVLQPVTGATGGLLAPANTSDTSSGGLLAPVTNTVGGLLSPSSPAGGTGGGLLDPVNDVGNTVGGVGGGALAPVQGVVGNVTGTLTNTVDSLTQPILGSPAGGDQPGAPAGGNDQSGSPAGGAPVEGIPTVSAPPGAGGPSLLSGLPGSSSLPAVASALPMGGEALTLPGEAAVPFALPRTSLSDLSSARSVLADPLQRGANVPRLDTPLTTTGATQPTAAPLPQLPRGILTEALLATALLIAATAALVFELGLRRQGQPLPS